MDNSEHVFLILDYDNIEKLIEEKLDYARKRVVDYNSRIIKGIELDYRDISACIPNEKHENMFMRGDLGEQSYMMISDNSKGVYTHNIELHIVMYYESCRDSEGRERTGYVL
ncbi:MAG: hypothetical protein ATN35_01480 [Epulopiscium sp. Nele67-Bin004]|nr:MAG: hypothetical protein ATN35_01480 [Epulopiscium sp. Nele67-Bin004]